MTQELIKYLAVLGLWFLLLAVLRVDPRMQLWRTITAGLIVVSIHLCLS